MAGEKKKLVGTGRHLSTMKRHRQSLKQNERNTHIKSLTKTELKKARTLVTAGNKEDALKQLKSTISRLAKAASKGVIPKNRAARLSSRLSKSVNAMN